MTSTLSSLFSSSRAGWSATGLTVTLPHRTGHFLPGRDLSLMKTYSGPYSITRQGKGIARDAAGD